MSKSSDLGVREASEERDDVVHKVLVIDNGVLTLFHQKLHKLAEVTAKLLPLLTALD